MIPRKYTLLMDGTSDRVLHPILQWMLDQCFTDTAWTGQTADFQFAPKKPVRLPDRVAAALDLYPCEVLFIHRDAEREPPEKRVKEIRNAMLEAKQEHIVFVPVIPVRMTEAWLLISESAIRRAAGNPNGKVPLHLPTISRLESLPDPKEELKTLLEKSSELTGRRLKKFNFSPHRAIIPDYVDDWSPLLELPSARTLFEKIQDLAKKYP
ncbi:MAG: DUF4276 family protein [Kiritimatiellae bacterium]|nr:DUF4276 family protein [Kiritimatiellia bacterium]